MKIIKPIYNIYMQSGRIDGFKKYLFRQGQAVIEPQLIKNIAEDTDNDLGKNEKYEPKDFIDYLKMGVPGLREEVPKKEKRVY
jgi:hypothetical protein